MIIHVANIEIDQNSGMGRVAFEWEKAFLHHGVEFKHLNARIIGYKGHHLLLGKAFRTFIKSLPVKPSLLLVHEPFGGWLLFKDIPTVIFSHGVEQRAWNVRKFYGFDPFNLKSKIILQKIRFFSNTLGFKKAKLNLVLNHTDKLFVEKITGRSGNVAIFSNGIYENDNSFKERSSFNFLFMGTWIPRKGIELIHQAFNLILKQYQGATLILAGVGNKEIILQFNENVRNRILVIPNYSLEEEIKLLASSDVFLLPSFFEGQSLALLQAMSMGLCPLVSSNSGQKDIIIHLKNGLVFETGDLQDFIKQIKFAIEQKMKIREMGRRASSCNHLYSWEIASEEVVNKVLSQIKL